MAITRRDPFRDLLGLQNEMTRLFGRNYGDNGGEARSTWAPPIDIYETPEAVNEGTLTIKGERRFYDEVNKENFHRVERRFGAFQRSVSLPAQVEADKVEASFDKGVLTVSIPKTEQAKPRRIEIKARA